MEDNIDPRETTVSLLGNVLSETRSESMGITLEKIAQIISEKFSHEEVEVLIKELNDIRSKNTRVNDERDIPQESAEEQALAV